MMESSTSPDDKLIKKIVKKSVEKSIRQISGHFG